MKVYFLVGTNLLSLNATQSVGGKLIKINCVSRTSAYFKG